ncbi:MAG: phosphomannomutase/phosphoglucomutase, partial [Angelakisella sp.]
NVINEAIRLNSEGYNSPLAIETSGHGALRENYFLDDGAYMSAKIIIKMAKLREQGNSLGELLEKLRDPLEAEEFRIKICCEDFKAYGAKVLEAFADYAKGREDWKIAPDSFEGLRADVPAAHGWFLLRLSLHDPQMPLNIESDKAGGVAEIAAQLREFLAGYSELRLPENL